MKINYINKVGTWVRGALFTCRSTEATMHGESCYGAHFEQCLGIHARHRSSPVRGTRLTTDKETVPCHWWYDAYETGAARHVFAKYSGGSMAGFAAISDCTIGKGRGILSSTKPEEKRLRRLLKSWLPASQASTDVGVFGVPLVTSGGKPSGCFIVKSQQRRLSYRWSVPDSKQLQTLGGIVWKRR